MTRRISTNLASGGFTYIGLLILLALMGITTVAAIHLGFIMQRRSAEQELLEIGREYKNAFISYAIATPVGANRYPKSLEDLLLDPRYTQKKRHLRKIYIDPINDDNTWGLIKSPDGTGIIGVHSLSNAQPIKVGNFDDEFIQFADKRSYRDWVFGATF
ncbi:type II secretion system protein [Undibacterium sp. LX15W]|uniref:Type II secretion system protein n=2 Tax=Undibacterium flavidum TaxID=2762297 RepID=A0ABR6YED3_9BURK|nr:type II secretion system protein [Undibacterium flavidum]